MIRDYTKFDMEEIVKIYTSEYQAMPDEIETIKSASKILVFEENQQIQGFIHLDINGDNCYMEIGVASDEQVMTVGLELWQEAQKVFTEKSVRSITTFHVKENKKWHQFFDAIEFDYWYSVYRFCYEGTKFEDVQFDGAHFDEAGLCSVKYEDQHYVAKMSLESEAFSVLREENDIKPYNWYLAASEVALENNRIKTNKNKDYIDLFFEGAEMVGASMVKDAEIELLFVNVKYQGKGYGKKILQFAVNRGLEQNASKVNLTALASNDKALKLYMNNGFRVVQAQDCRRLKLS